MTTNERIIEVETAASRAWPARHTRKYGGWLFRATEGITRRANSVLPLGKPEVANLTITLEQVQQFYRQYKLPVRFQMTTASQPGDLDAFLDAEGLVIDREVNVLTAALPGIVLEEPEVGVVILGEPWEDWFVAYQKFTGFEKRNITVRKEIIARIDTKKAFGAAVIDDAVVGIGLAVVDGDWLGLFSLVTQEEFRRHHVATSVTQSLVSWGLSQGASQGYLQVEEANSPAQKFYYGIGFEDTYSYWYRVTTE